MVILLSDRRNRKGGPRVKKKSMSRPKISGGISWRLGQIYLHQPTQYSDPGAMTQAIVADLAEPIDRTSYISTVLGPQLRLTLQADDQVVFRDIVDTADLLSANSTPFYYEHELAPDQYQLRLTLEDDSTDIIFVLVDEPVSLEAGQIFRYGH